MENENKRMGIFAGIFDDGQWPCFVFQLYVRKWIILFFPALPTV